MPLLGIVVAAKDDPLVGRVAALDHRLDGLLEWGAALDGLLELIREVIDRLGHDRVQNSVGQRKGHARAQRAELELVAGERERARPVAVTTVHGQRGEDRRAQSEERAGR